PQVLIRAEEALRKDRDVGHRPCRPQILEAPPEAPVDQDRDGARAGAFEGGDKLFHPRAGAKVAGRGRTALDLGDGRAPRLRERVPEPTHDATASPATAVATGRPTSVPRRAAAAPESIRSTASRTPSARSGASPATTSAPA